MTGARQHGHDEFASSDRHAAARRIRYATALAALAPFVISATLTACDPIYGVARPGRVAFMPPPAQVDSILRSVPGVDSVEYEVSEGGREITLHGLEPPDTTYTFIYRGAGELWGALQFTVDAHHRVEYLQSSQRMNQRPPQREIDVVLPVMREIEARLETRAGLVGLRDSVRQTCRGVRCS